MLYNLFYVSILRKLKEILKTKNSFFLYDLLSSKNSFLGIPIDYIDNGNGIEICLEIDLEKKQLQSYQGFSNSDFLEMVKVSIQSFCQILENLKTNGILNEIPNIISLATSQSNRTVDSLIVLNNKLNYVDFFKSEYQIAPYGQKFINSIFGN